ncbi:peptidoglycan hydrolase [Anaerococcus sp. WCA-380-WT-2B]|uniref:Peptidoglycan hydrolase n=1 Tax=Anaerococcus porci TaxID=2652269 RepID=A0A6N7VD46_9FIRM|nr:peptidoglycan amidohydrolase family protein [Anaerococcus porci]MSS77368.1 peptidoglycan hydrolase [Anaerococcus porci]
MASVENMITYAKSRWHVPKYVMGGGRIGAEASYNSNTDDCSSFVYKCLKKGGFIPETMWNGSTEDLFKLARQGKYLKEISYKEVRRGDIFVKGREGGSGGEYGHTGIFLRKGEIIHCNAGQNWTVTTNNESEGYWYYLDNSYYPVRYFRPIGNVDNTTERTEIKQEEYSGGKKFIKNENWYGITQAVCNVRADASTNSAIVAQYGKGQKINYDSVYEGDGFRWISYIGYSGERRFVAYRQLTGDTTPWIKF